MHYSKVLGFLLFFCKQRFVSHRQGGTNQPSYKNCFISNLKRIINRLPKRRKKYREKTELLYACIQSIKFMDKIPMSILIDHDLLDHHNYVYQICHKAIKEKRGLVNE
jgi:hypothetical protein